MPSFDKAVPAAHSGQSLHFSCVAEPPQINFVQSNTVECIIPTDRGSLCAAWHTNGLIDPLEQCWLIQRNLSWGRHDLVTRPILSFWTRRLAVQPVVRKAELPEGAAVRKRQPT